MAENGRENRGEGEDALAVALASGQTLRSAAAPAGMGERTATRRWADATFRRHVARLRTDMVGRARGRVADGMSEAADVLRQLLTAESESVRLRAAVALLDAGKDIHAPDAEVEEPHAVEGTADVVRLLGERLHQLDAGQLPPAEKARLTATLADSLLRAIGVDVLDKRLEALQTVLLKREDKK
jgi:hypothetical protein